MSAKLFRVLKGSAGLGHFISTYETDGDPLPSFVGEPIPVTINVAHGLESFAAMIWNALDEANKVSLYARECNLRTGDVNDLIINKHISEENSAEENSAEEKE